MKFNKTSTTIIASLAMVAFVAMSFDINDDNGKAGRTNSPGEGNCTGCHTGSPVNDGNGSVVISSPDLANWEYMPGDTYTIEVTVSRSGSALFGFDLECLTGSAPAQNAGTLIVTNSSQTHILNALVSTVTRKNMTHQLNSGLGSSTKTFSFKWAAPTSNVGNVTFYCAGNATNNDGTKFNDHIYTTSQVVTPAFGAGISSVKENNSGFSVFPNPAQSDLHVSFAAPAGESVSFSLFTYDGKQAGPEYSFTASGAEQTSTIYLPADLAPGMYILKMEQGDEISLQKIVID